MIKRCTKLDLTHYVGKRIKCKFTQIDGYHMPDPRWDDIVWKVEQPRRKECVTLYHPDYDYRWFFTDGTREIPESNSVLRGNISSVEVVE